MVGDWGYWVICEWVANTAVIIYNWIGLDWRFQGVDADFHRSIEHRACVRFHARIWTTTSNTEIRWSSFPIVAEDDGPRRDHPKNKDTKKQQL